MRAPLFFFDSTTVFFDITKGLQKNQSDTQNSVPQTRSDKRLCCGVCHNPITTHEDAVVINGQHSHTKSNPTGKSFLFNCYSQANGCILAGEFSSEFSWFGGYDWCYALCQSCNCQLGWYFAGEQTFFALIKEQLVDCKSQA